MNYKMYATYIVFSSLVILLVACNKNNYPKGKPFVYENKIEIENNELNKEQKTVLGGRLKTQLADSMQVRLKSSLPGFRKLQDPAIFDTAQASLSVANMEIFLKTTGYYYGKVTYDTVLKIKKNQQRVITTFRVKTGPAFRMATIDYFFADTNLQRLACNSLSETLIKKGDPFNESVISAELNRLIDIFRNNGYYKISREQLFADVDTVFLPLLNPLLDPFERIQVLREAQQKRQNPTIDVFIRTKPKLDSTAIRVFNVRNITVYPEFKGEQTDTVKYNITVKREIVIKSLKNKFNPSFIVDHIYLKPGKIYKLAELNKTANELNNLATWQFIKVQPRLFDSIQQVDFDIYMTPLKKYRLSPDLELAINNIPEQSVTLPRANLVGFGANLEFDIRNFTKRGIVFTNVLRGGLEFPFLTEGVKGLQSTEISYGNSLNIPSIPKFWYDLFKKHAGSWNNKKTFISSNISRIRRNADGKFQFRLLNIGAGFGWQYQTAKGNIINIRPLNIELVRLVKSSSFNELLDRNPFLRNSFTEGFVIGNFNASWARSRSKIIADNKITRSISLNFEESGALLGRLGVLKNELFQYLKLESQYKYEIKKRNYDLVFRAIAGAGYRYGNDTSNMPFFKQFSGGGPNSMRGWPVRSIGPGARPLDAREQNNRFFSQSGDIIFESNIEYRYNIATVLPNTFVLRGALFTDIGNVWNFQTKNQTNSDTIILQLKDFYRDLGVSAGTGFRFDFIGLFILRFDFALRLKTPALPSTPNAGWRDPKIKLQHFISGKPESRNWRYDHFNFTLGINYPF